MKEKFERFLIFCSGANWDILSHSPLEKPRFLLLGSLILLSTIFSVLAIGYTIYYTTNSIIYIVWLGTLWPAVILSLNRELFRPRPQKTSFIVWALNLTVAAFIGCINSIPVLFLMFGNEINSVQAAAVHSKSALVVAFNQLLELSITDDLLGTTASFIVALFVLIEILPILVHIISSNDRYHEILQHLYMEGNFNINAKSFTIITSFYPTIRESEKRTNYNRMGKLNRPTTFKQLAVVLFSPLTISMFSGGAFFGYIIDPIAGALIGSILGYATGVAIASHRVSGYICLTK